MNLMSSLNISAGALSVNEKAISVVSHNVANMNTEGYHKQRTNLAARNIAGQIGDNPANQVRANGGVKITNIMRYNDDYLNNYYRDQLSKKNYLEQQLGDLDELAGIFDDLEGTGIDAALSDFYEALNNMNQYPASSSARTNFIERANTLVKTLNTKTEQLNNLTGASVGTGDSVESLENSRIYIQVQSFNDSLEDLAAVNKALQTTQTGTLTANNLLDQRDLILHDIAQFVDIKVEEKPNGSVNVYMGDYALVKGAKVTGSFELETAKQYKEEHPTWQGTDPVIVSIVEKDGNSTSVIYDNINDAIKGGSIGGLIASGRDTDDTTTNPTSVQNKLNKLAKAVAKIFNDLNTSANAFSIDKDNTSHLVANSTEHAEENATNYLFINKDKSTTSSVSIDDIDAGNIALNYNLFTDDGIWDICCAYFDDLSNYDENAVGNSNNVVSMLETRNTKYTLAEQGIDLDGMSIEDFYASMLGRIAAAGDSAQTLYDTQCDVVDSIDKQLDAAYGVDLNEELVDLVKYQTAYAAAAQVFNVVNSCLDSLMTLGR